MRYNPALDGLRAVAVMLVVLLHAYPSKFPGGWVGVDIFFVLSGYLITSILAGEIDRTGSISFRDFYFRRALRLTPALLIVCLFQLARSPFSEHPGMVRASIIPALLYLNNWNAVFQWTPGDVLGPTWSLAIEEQFYLLWPLALPFIFRRRPEAWLAAALVAMVALRFALWDLPQGLQEYTFLRPCGLLVGCLVALWSKGANLRPEPWAVSLALSAIVVILLVADENAVTFREFMPLTASILAAAIILFADPNGFLSFAPLRYIGRVSYGFYLYHVPILVVAKSPRLPHLPPTVLLLIAFGLAVLSYEFVEKPILGLKGRSQRDKLELQPKALKGA